MTILFFHLVSLILFLFLPLFTSFTTCLLLQLLLLYIYTYSNTTPFFPILFHSPLYVCPLFASSFSNFKINIPFLQCHTSPPPPPFISILTLLYLLYFFLVFFLPSKLNPRLFFRLHQYRLPDTVTSPSFFLPHHYYFLLLFPLLQQTFRAKTVNRDAASTSISGRY